MCNGLERRTPALTVIIPRKNELEELGEMGKVLFFSVHFHIIWNTDFIIFK